MFRFLTNISLAAILWIVPSALFSQTTTAKDKAELSLKMKQRAHSFKEALQSSSGKVAAVYIYPFTRQAYRDKPEKLAARLSLLGITDVYIEVSYEALNIDQAISTSISWDQLSTAWFKTFNSELSNYGINSHAQLFGTWELFSTYWEKMVNLECDLFVNFQGKVAGNQKFYGIAADIEPHATASKAFDKYEEENYFEWRWKHDIGYENGNNVNSEMIRHTYDVLSMIKNKTNVPLDQATNWAMQLRVDRTVEDGKYLTYGNSTDYFDIGKCNTISVMSYRDTKEGTWERFKPSLDNLKKGGAAYNDKAICSIDVYANEGEGGISLYSKGWDYMLGTICYVNEQAQGYDAFAGIAFFDYSGLESLWEGGNFLYNEGDLSLVGDSTSLFIGGDFITGTNSAGEAQAWTCNVTVKDAAKAILVGDFRHNASVGNVFTGTTGGVFEFRGNGHQAITTDGMDFSTIPSKKDNYISFPQKVEINNNKHVTLDPSLAAKMPELDLNKGWLILDSREAEGKDYDGTVAEGDELIINRTVFAHLLAEKINYNNSKATDPDARGAVQVNMQLDNRTVTSDLADGYYQPYRSLVGFGIPFKEMRADYFMFNFLVAPTNKSFFGDSRSTIMDPKVTLTAGRGYGLGIDLRGTAQDDYRDIGRWVPVENFEYRVTGDPTDESMGKYLFNRHNFSQNMHKANQLFGSDLSHNAYALEELNTGDVTVNLDKAGEFYYLANPFMTPLNLTDIINGSMEDWAYPAIENSVWIMTGNTSMAVADYGESKAKVIYKFYVAQSPGGTFTGVGDADNEYDNSEKDEVHIAPLQMFMVKSTAAGKMKIPANKRKMGRAKFLKSISKERYDDFIFEVTDIRSGISDRVSIVLRPANEIIGHKEWTDVEKLSTKDTNIRSRSEDIAINQALQSNIFSQIYTKGSDDTAYTVQFFPLETTASIPLYLTPATEAQEIRIKGLRLNTMRDVSVIYLQDKKENEIIKMDPETVYTTTSDPNDSTDRFVVHFKKVDKEILTPSTIWAYYKDGLLTVSGFEEDDFGSTLYLFSMAGAKYSQVKVNSEVMYIPCDLALGVYLLRLEGNREKTIKVLVN